MTGVVVSRHMAQAGQVAGCVCDLRDTHVNLRCSDIAVDFYILAKDHNKHMIYVSMQTDRR